MRSSSLAAALIVLVPGVARADVERADTMPLEDKSGTAVKIVASTLDTTIFVARGYHEPGEFPDMFQRIGTAPVKLTLAPGVYTVESSNPSSSVGHAIFKVEQGSPITIEVKNGDSGVKSVGAVCIGAGVLAMILGVVALVSISADDQHYNRFAVSLPLLGVGAGLTGVGVGMSALGSTRIVTPDALPPNTPQPAQGKGFVGSLTFRF